MKSFFAVTASLGLLLAASGGAMACSFKNVTAEAPMTPIVTAGTTTPSTPVVITDEKADDKG